MFHKPKGLLYKSIELVSKKLNVNPDNFFKKYEINDSNDLEKDNENLRKLLGFKNFTTIYTKNTWGKYSLEPHADYIPMTLIFALFIVLFKPENFSEIIIASKEELNVAIDNENISEDGFKFGKDNSPPQEPFKYPVPVNLCLGLVIKGIDLGNISLDQKNIILDNIQSLIDKSSYYLCASQNDMNNIISQISFDIDEIDRNSEKQVLMSLSFEHKMYIGQQIDFPKKFMLKKLLSDCPGPFKIDRLQALARISGLGKLGFNRS
jgi:hypothetical protein